MQVLPIWGLAIPLPAVMMITAGLYMVVLFLGLWIRYCLKDCCSCQCDSCCPDLSVSERCFRLAEMCDCTLPTFSAFMPNSCSSSSCLNMDCACMCQPSECKPCDCICLEIRVK